MKRISSLCAMALFLAATVAAQDGREGKDGGKRDRSERGSEGEPSSSKAEGEGKPDQRQPMVIRMGQPQGHEGRKTVDDASAQKPQARSASKDKPYQAPAYGQARGQDHSASKSGSAARSQTQAAARSERPAIGSNEARVVSRRTEAPGEVRERLRKIGVKSEPGFIVDRSEMVVADRKHSMAPRPERGWDNRELRATPIGPRRFDVDVVRNHMSRVGRPDYMERIRLAGARETERNHHYWHRDQGFAYSHFVDGFGFQWYGWYVGTAYFWTRYHAGRWWWYDDGYGRWCFWNDNFWWWQDPNHVGDLYCYHDSTYIPVNSADDQIEVASPAQPDSTVFPSPDGSRVVKILSESKDAFLYDAVVPARFKPKYLASGVVDVQYSNSVTGRPLEIVLKLDDGTFDLLDADGEPYVAPASGTKSINSN